MRYSAIIAIAPVMPLTSGQRSGIAAFILLNFIAGAWLFTNGEAYWYFLLHNGLLLPAKVGLVCLSALARDPDSHWLRHWSPRLGAASLSIFALHVPLFNLFRTLEQLLRGDPKTCFSDRERCTVAAGNVQLSLPGYGIFLLATVVICLLFQEQIVTRVRQFLTTHFLPRKACPERNLRKQATTNGVMSLPSLRATGRRRGDRTLLKGDFDLVIALNHH